jgi:hypothetical protein
VARSSATPEESAVPYEGANQEVNRADALRGKERFMGDIVHCARKR